MKYWSNKRLVFPLVTGASLIIALVGQAQAQPRQAQLTAGILSPDDPAAKLDPQLIGVPAMPEPKTDTSQTFPLSPDNPAAKLDPSLVNVPAVPEPKIEHISPSNSSSTPATEIGYDVSTGSIQVGKSRASQ